MSRCVSLCLFQPALVGGGSFFGLAGTPCRRSSFGTNNCCLVAIALVKSLHGYNLKYIACTLRMNSDTTGGDPALRCVRSDAGCGPSNRIFISAFNKASPQCRRPAPSPCCSGLKFCSISAVLLNCANVGREIAANAGSVFSAFKWHNVFCQ